MRIRVTDQEAVGDGKGKRFRLPSLGEPANEWTIIKDRSDRRSPRKRGEENKKHGQEHQTQAQQLVSVFVSPFFESRRHNTLHESDGLNTKTPSLWTQDGGKKITTQQSLHLGGWVAVIVMYLPVTKLVCLQRNPRSFGSHTIVFDPSSSSSKPALPFPLDLSRSHVSSNYAAALTRPPALARRHISPSQSSKS
ncbi:hypothetical protein CIHG_04204 [Coccidioides immitis H538.4]|uniref:Uncharacterized protein n=3 Tax=Coccidioides immitis TaxID=5501 RepID=A0A0J8QZ09_COCIT|nr:hypothetical protein CIRG_04595 [Coccidioides immitis RMSCC 2394]KMU78109.1 hypothetical protein CISG_06950 [Coccidioides immitis RMSCC 3703]KMU86415.1 hypothetical protein CIHG_04204 [Coccidioides immitis H538.4]